VKHLNNIKLAGIISLALGISACGGGSSSSTPVSPTATTYTVAVSVPDAFSTTTVSNHNPSLKDQLLNFILPGAYAVDGNDLSADNFAVTIVDPNGNVTEIVEVAAENISQNPDGTWEISVPGDPRLDCIIIADISKPATVTVGSPVPPDVVFAPTTAPTVDIDIQSTAAYQEFLATLPATVTTFAELTNISVDEVENIVNKAQEVVLPSITPGQTLEEYVQTAIVTVQDVIAAEVEIATNSTAGTLSEALTTGIHWFDAFIFSDGTFDFVDYIEYGILTSTGEEFYESTGGAFTLSGAGTDWYLTSTGWQEVTDTGSGTANADGSVTFTLTGLPEVQYLSASTQVVDVSGLAISSFFPDADGWSNIIPAAATFSANAGKAYSSTWTSVNETFEADDIMCDPTVSTQCWSAIWVEIPGVQSGNIATLTELVSSTTGTKGYHIGNTLNGGIVAAELVDDGTSKTVAFYEIDYSAGLTITPLAATSTWEIVTRGGVTLYRYSIPASIQSNTNYNLWSDSSSNILFESAGYVRSGQYTPAGFLEDGEEWFFDATAGAEIISAADTSLLNLGSSVGAPTTTVVDCFYSTPPGSLDSYVSFLAKVTDCGGALPVTDVDVVGTWVAQFTATDYETIIVNADGTGTFGETIAGVAQPTIAFNWTLANGGITVTDTGGFVLDIWVNTANGWVAYTEETIFSSDLDITDPTTLDGEIWDVDFIKQ